MDRERLKLIVRNLELLVDGLKAEVYSDVDAYVKESPKTSGFMNFNSQLTTGRIILLLSISWYGIFSFSSHSILANSKNFKG